MNEIFTPAQAKAYKDAQQNKEKASRLALLNRRRDAEERRELKESMQELGLL